MAIPPVGTKHIFSPAIHWDDDLNHAWLWMGTVYGWINLSDLNYIYMAWASDDQGTDFTTTFDPDLAYIAFLSSPIKIETPIITDFDGLWAKYKGDNALIIHGLGMDFADGDPVDLGMPSTIDSTTENALTEHSHTHKIGFISMDDVVSGSPVEYGALYNWYAATDARGLANSGWSVPSKSDFTTLVTTLDGWDDAGGHLKEIGTQYWNASVADNSSKFNGRGSGERGSNGVFASLKRYLMLFSSTQYDSTHGEAVEIRYNGTEVWGDIHGGYSYYKKSGYSIRLVKSSTTLTNGQSGTYTGNDGKVYPTICIGTQEWLACNLNETKYANGEWITGFDGGVYTPITDVAWAALTTEAMCYYGDSEANGGGQTPIEDSIPAAQIQADWDQSDNAALDFIKNKPNIPDPQVGDNTYIGLGDTTDAAYTGKAKGVPMVNDDEDAMTLELTELATFLILDDVDAPNGYTGHGGKFVKVKTDVSGVEFGTAALADLSEDSTHRLTTDTEKATWNGKQDALKTTVTYFTYTI